MGGSSEEPKCPEMLEVFQVVEEAGPSHVLKDKTVGKKTSLVEKKALAGTQLKKESL